MDATLKDLAQDRKSLEAILRSLILERDQQKQRAEQEHKRANELHLENLRLQLELERYKKWRYGPRADRLATSADVAQALLEFAEQLESKPIHPEDVPAKAESEYELRRVKRRPGRRHLASFENLPVTTQVYELSAEQRICPCCGVERKEIGADESWQIEYIPGRFERIQHLRKKYACSTCEKSGENPLASAGISTLLALHLEMRGQQHKRNRQIANNTPPRRER